MSKLTEAGIELSRAMLRRKVFDPSYMRWKQHYDDSISLRGNVTREVRNAKRVMLIGSAASLRNIPVELLKEEEVYRVGINNTAYYPGINLNLLVATHYAVAHGPLFSYPSIKVAHLSYSKVPPLFVNSFTMRWYDPFIVERYPVMSKSAKQLLGQQIDVKEICPCIRAPRNVFFVALQLLISMGARDIVICGFDAKNPGYFFTGDRETCSTIALDLLKTDIYLSDWDGRTERCNAANFYQPVIDDETNIYSVNYYKHSTFAKGVLNEAEKVRGDGRVFVDEYENYSAIYSAAMKEFSVC